MAKKATQSNTTTGTPIPLEESTIVERQNAEMSEFQQETPGAQLEIVRDVEAHRRQYSLHPNPAAIRSLSMKVVDDYAQKAIYYGDEETKIFQPSKIAEILSSIPGESKIVNAKSFYSFQLSKRFERLKHELSPGNLVEAQITFYFSMDKTEKEFASIDLGVLICKNGAMRKQQYSYEDFSALNEQAIIRTLEGAFELQIQRGKNLLEKKFKPSFLEMDISEKVKSLGMPEKWVKDAHYIIHKETENFHNGELNGWTIYNGFNNILFSRTDSSLNHTRKVSIDEKLMKLFEHELN